jgi:hypothetical protein
MSHLENLYKLIGDYKALTISEEDEKKIQDFVHRGLGMGLYDCKECKHYKVKGNFGGWIMTWWPYCKKGDTTLTEEYQFDNRCFELETNVFKRWWNNLKI